MSYPEAFKGYMIESHEEWFTFKKQDFKPKIWDENDIDIEIECCGMCGSDVHTITGGWGKKILPLAVGHEVVGRAVRVGSAVKDVKIGDRVGVGAQIWSCLNCPQCNNNHENYCPKWVDTYGKAYPAEADPGRTISQGGFSSHIRAHQHFVFPIPDAIPSYLAAPMLCAGLTVWSPLKRAQIGRGSKVAVVGLGGLGHFAVIWANALDAEVTVISHSSRKRDDAIQLGAKNFVDSSSAGWAEPYAFAFDLVMNTANMTHKFNMEEYLSICNVNAAFHQLGLPEHALPEVRSQMLLRNGSSISASHIGSRQECLDMLDFAAKKRLFPMVESIPISEEGCAEAVKRVSRGNVSYRITLTEYDKVFGTS